MNKEIYLDNSAATKVDNKVVKAMEEFFSFSYGNSASLHSLGRKSKKALEFSRMKIAKTINAYPYEIIFTSGGTESDNIALIGAAFGNKDRGNHIITTKIEHPAVLNACKFLEEKGFKITCLDVDKEGFISLDKLKKKIIPKTILVSVIHGNNEIGTIQPIKEIGKICAQKKILFHTDCVQSFTKVPIDVRKQNISLASFSSHKIHGPKGVGALFVKKGVKLKPLFYGGGQEFRLRPGTENVPGIVGFAKAVELALKSDKNKISRLRDMLIERIEKEISDVKLNGPRDKRLCNNVNFSFKFIEGESLLLRLDDKGICVSTGSACTSQSLKPSHVLIAIGLRPEIAHGSIRFSLSRFTTKQEILYTVESLKEIVENLRKISPLGR